MSARPLDHLPPLPSADAVAVAGAVSAALGEIHNAGLVHGALGPDRVLVDEAGVVSLLPAVDPVVGHVEAADDVAALGRLLEWLAERAPDHAAHCRAGLLRTPHPVELLAELASRCLAPSPADRPSPRLVADTLHRRMPRAPLADLLLPQSRGRSAVSRRGAVGAVAAAALLGALAGPAQCSTSSSSAVVDAPRPDRSSWADGVLVIGSGRYAVGDSDDHVVVDRWSCGPSAVALLRRPEGEVVAFDRLPDHGQPAVGRTLAHVPEATRLVARRTRESCAALAVATADGRTVPVEWKEAL